MQLSRRRHHENNFRGHLALLRQRNYSVCFFRSQRSEAGTGSVSGRSANGGANRNAPKCEVGGGMNMELFGKPNATPIDNATPINSVLEPPQIVWGAATAAERGPVVATLRNPAPPQRGRHARRRLFGLPRARDRGRDARTRPHRRSHRHRAGRARSGRIRNGRCQEDRLARSVGPPRRRGVPRVPRRAATTSGRRSRSPAPISTCRKSARPSLPAASAPTAASCRATAACA